MAFENYTTGTEVDPNGDIGVAANKLTITSMSSNVDAMVYWDKGVNHFAGDFRHRVKVTINALTGTYPGANFWGVSNTVDDGYGLWTAFATAIVCKIAYHTGLGRWIFYIRDCNNQTSAYTTTAWATSTPYYVEIEKDTVAGTIALRVYSDAAYSVLVEQISKNYSSNVSYQYLFGCASENQSQAGWDITLDIENLDLNEPAPPAANCWLYIYSDAAHTVLVDALSIYVDPATAFEHAFGCNAADQDDTHTVTFDVYDLDLNEGGGLEDWTAYTEEDAGGYITVSANTLDVNAMPRNVTSMVYDDKGGAHFQWFVHDFSFKPIAHDSDQGFCAVWAVANTVDDIESWLVNVDEALFALLVWNPPESEYPGWGLQLFDAVTVNQDSSVELTQGMRYYARLLRPDTSASEVGLVEGEFEVLESDTLILATQVGLVEAEFQVLESDALILVGELGLVEAEFEMLSFNMHCFPPYLSLSPEHPHNRRIAWTDASAPADSLFYICVDGQIAGKTDLRAWDFSDSADHRIRQYLRVGLPKPDLSDEEIEGWLPTPLDKVDLVADSEADRYVWERDSVEIAETTAASFTDGPLVDGTYIYEVTAYDEEGDAAASAPQTVVISTAPEPPTDLDVTEGS